MADIRLTGNIKLLGTTKQLEQQIIRGAMDQVARQINGRVLRRKGTLLKEIRENVKLRIVGSNEWQSMLSGQLRGQLGLDNPQERLTKVLDIWLDSIQIGFSGFRAVGGRMQGNLKVYGIQANYEDVININEALIELEKGMFPWLSIMLLAGDSVLVRNYTLLTSSKVAAYSRSDTQTIMVKSQSKSWQVPANYSGVRDNNFVTRCLVGIDDFIQDRLMRVLNG